MIYFFFGISNGIFFAPPSELLIWFAIRDGSIGINFHIFIISNTLGHLLLFFLSSRHKVLFMKSVCWVTMLVLRRDYSIHYKNSIEWLHEKSGWYIFYGRLMPFFHTFTSIVAGFYEENVLKFFIFTLLGNYTFGFLIFLHFKILSQFLNQFSYIFVLLASVVIVHLIIKRKIDRI
jgi:membrane protein DedA with SNARE-associated domain